MRYSEVSFELFDFLREQIFEFGQIGGLQFEWLSDCLYLFDRVSELFYLFDPLVDVQLILVYISLNHCYIINYFLGLLRHHFYLFYQICLLLHMQLFKIQDKLLFIAE